MASSRSLVSTLVGHFVLALLSAGVTYAAFVAFVAASDRARTFYFALSLVCSAEFVLFMHLAYSRLARDGVVTASVPSRIQVHVLIFAWFLITVISAALVVVPGRAETTAGKILAIYLILTLLLFISVYFIYSRDVALETLGHALTAERRSIQINVPDLEEAMAGVKTLGNRHGQHAVLADRVCKKLDTVRSGLEAVLVSERVETASADGAENWIPRLEQQVASLVDLSRKAALAEPDQASQTLEGIASQADAVLTTLKRRERLITG